HQARLSVVESYQLHDVLRSRVWFRATITIDGTRELRFLPSNPNRPSPDDVFGNRVGRAPFHWQCEDRTRSAASRHRLDDNLPHPSDKNEHDPDQRGSPKTASRGRSQ